MFRYVAALVFAVLPTIAFAATSFEIVIQRNMSCNNGEAAGSLSIDGDEVARTLELPWRDNQQDISRVPAGIYKATVRADGNLRWRIQLEGVPDRTNVQLHVGNYPRDTVGCVLVGTNVTSANNTCAVSGSSAAMQSLKAAMDKASDNGVSSQPLSITVDIRD